MFKVLVITVVTIAAATLIIIGFIKFTSSSDCKAIINDSDYETTVKITELKVIKSIDNKSSNNSSNSINNNWIHKIHLLKWL